MFVYARAKFKQWRTRMTIIDFMPFIIALFVTAIIPGPGVAACVGKALGSGFKPAMVFLLGLIAGDVFYMTLAVVGGAALASTFGWVLLIIKWAGSGYLFYLAYSFWNAGIDPSKVDVKRGDTIIGSLIGGFSVTMGNPKAVIFYMALLPSVVDLTMVDVQRYIGLVVCTIVVLLVSMTPYILAAAKAREMMREPKLLRILNRGAAVAMALAGFFVLIKA